MASQRIAYADSNEATRSPVVALLRSTLAADVVGLRPAECPPSTDVDCLVVRWDDSSTDRAIGVGDRPDVVVVGPDALVEMVRTDAEVVPVASPEDYSTLAETIRGVLDTDPELPVELSDELPYRSLVNSAADPMYVLDDAGQLQMVNEAFVDQFGYERSELLGAGVDQFLPAEAYRRGTELLKSLLEGEPEDDNTFEVEMEVEGLPRTLEIKLAPIGDDDRYRGSVGTIRDVTARDRRQRELARYEKMLETVPVGIYTIDVSGKIVWTNRYFADIFGRAPADLIGTEFASLVLEGYFERSPKEMFSFYEGLIDELLHSDAERVDNIGHIYTDTGEKRTYALRTGLLPPEDGEFTGTITAFREITAQVENERALERQNERLDEFASIVSHDLRNPINVARGYLQAARENGDETALDEVAISLDRMEEIVDQMLTLSREGDDIETAVEVDLDEVVGKAWQSVDTVDATLSVHTDRTVEADPARLRQAFENLFRNCVDHGGATVSITVGDLDDGSGLFVADDGPGIPVDRRETIFDTGTTTSPDGTGFGLSIVRRIVTAHGWTIRVTESEAGGARFEIEYSRVPRPGVAV